MHTGGRVKEGNQIYEAKTFKLLIVRAIMV